MFYWSVLWRSFYDRMIFPAFVLEEKTSVKKLIAVISLLAVLCSSVRMLGFMNFLSNIPVQMALENVPEIVLEDKGITTPENFQYAYNQRDYFFVIDTTNSEVQVPDFGYGVFLGKDHFMIKSGVNAYAEFYSAFTAPLKAQHGITATKIAIPSEFLLKIYPEVLSKTKYLALLIGGVMMFFSEFLRLFLWMIIFRSFTKWIFAKHKVFLQKVIISKITLLSMTPWVVLNQVGRAFGVSGLSGATNVLLCLTYFVVFTLYWLKEVKKAQIILTRFIEQSKK